MKKSLKLFVMLFTVVFALCAISAVAYAVSIETPNNERTYYPVPEEFDDGYSTEGDGYSTDDDGYNVEDDEGNRFPTPKDEDRDNDDDGDNEERMFPTPTDGGNDDQGTDGGNNGGDDKVTNPTSNALPQTGDDSSLALFIGIMLISAAGLVLVLNKALNAKKSN